MKESSPAVNTRSRTAAPRSNSWSLKGQYLLVYNALSLGLWISLLVRVIITTVAAAAGYMRSTKPSILAGLPHIYPSVGQYVTWVQTLAILEILHAAFGLVKAPVATTAIQISGRLLQVWGVNYMFANEGLFKQKGLSAISLGSYDSDIQANQAAYLLMLVAWSIADATRYMYFIFRLSGEVSTLQIGVPKVLLWLRYNAFFVLYPIGIWSEWFLIFRSLELAEQVHPLYERVLNAVLMLYIPGAYVMYMHMVTQRNKAGHRELERLEKVEEEGKKEKNQ